MAEANGGDPNRRMSANTVNYLAQVENMQKANVRKLIGYNIKFAIKDPDET
jgi:hypothetical protein